MCIRDRDEWLTYVSVKSDDDGAALLRLRAWLQKTGLPPELDMHYNGNNLALMVRGAQKQDAVRRVAAEMEREGPIMTIGAGEDVYKRQASSRCDPSTVWVFA